MSRASLQPSPAAERRATEEEEKLEKARRQIRAPWIPLLLLLLTPVAYFTSQKLEGTADPGIEGRHRTTEEQRLRGENLKSLLEQTRLELISLRTDAGSRQAFLEVLKKSDRGPLRELLDRALTRAEGLQPHLRLLMQDSLEVVSTQVSVLLILLAYALVPGFAGLYYRDSFKAWYLLATLLLLALEIVFSFRYGVPVSEPLHYPHWWFTSFELLLILLFLAFRLRWRGRRKVLKWLLGLLGSLLDRLLGRRRREASRQWKYIVVCLDGTWNQPGQKDFGFRAETNVYKLWKSLKGERNDKYHPNATLCKRYTVDRAERQVGLYYSGVGNALEYTSLGAALGGAFGLGAEAIKERAYLDVAREYRPGDRIVIVGFSRGAAIARLLAAALEHRGVPKGTLTLRLFNRQRLLWASGKDKEFKIEVLGCWDTVGSFGIPKNILGIPFQRINLLKNLTVSLKVKRAYHLVALDETRDAFVPTLMDQDPVSPERIVEVWFSGNHANVGGGYTTDRLSDLTLDFMLRRLSSGYVDDPLLLLGDEEAWPWEARRLAARLQGGEEPPLEKAVNALAVVRRRAVELHFGEGRSVDEVVEELGSPKTVEQILPEARREVEEAMADPARLTAMPALERRMVALYDTMRAQIDEEVEETQRRLEGLEAEHSQSDEVTSLRGRLQDLEERKKRLGAEVAGALEVRKEEVEGELKTARSQVEEALKDVGWVAPGEERWGLFLSACNGARGEEGCLSLNPDSAGRIRRQTGPIYSHAPREIPLGASVHDSVLERLQHAEAEYAPESLFQLNQVIGKLREHILGQVDLLQGTASLGDLEAQRIRDWLEKRLSIRRWSETAAARDVSYREPLRNG